MTPILLAVLLPGLLGQVGSTSTSSPDHSGKVEGLVIISTNKDKINEVDRAYRPGIAYRDIEERLRNRTFRLATWGTRSAVVIDLSVGPLAELAKARTICDTLAKGLGPNLTLRLGDLPADERKEVVGLLDRYVPEPLRGNGGNLDEAAIGLYSALKVNIKGRDRAIDFSFTPTNEQTKKRGDELSKHPILPRKPTPEELSKVLSAQKTAELSRSEVSFHLRGVAKGMAVDAIREATKAFESVEREWQSETQRSARELLRKSGMKFSDSGEPLPAGDSRFGDLPADLKKDMSQQFGDSWQMLGFSSREEAESFLLNSGSLQLSMSLGLMHCSRPRGTGDPPTPGSYGITIFSTLRSGLP